MKNIREEKGLTYGISSTVSSLDLSGYKVISTEVSPKNCDRVIDEILHEIRLLQTVPVGNDELAVLRNYMSGEMVRMFDGPFAIAESFRSAWEFGLDINYFHRLSEKILKISPDEIMQLARTYYNTDDLYKVTVGLNEQKATYTSSFVFMICLCGTAESQINCTVPLPPVLYPFLSGLKPVKLNFRGSPANRPI